MERKPDDDAHAVVASSGELPIDESTRIARKRADVVLVAYWIYGILSLGLGIWVCASVPPETRMLVHSKHGNPIYLAPVAIFIPSIMLVSFVIAGVRDRKNKPEMTVKQMVGGLIAIFLVGLLFLGCQIGLAFNFWQEAGVL